MYEAYVQCENSHIFIRILTFDYELDYDFKISYVILVTHSEKAFVQTF